MENKKRFLSLQIFFVFIVLLTLIGTSSALRVSPAKTEINFEPNFEASINYRVTGADSEQEFELYTDGNLAEYVEFDKEELLGGGAFTATLKLPGYIERPGRHRIIVGVREKIDEEEFVGATITTSITIQVVIDVYVPYPGKYLEMTLNSHNANIGEPINFELNIINRGKEDVNITPQIQILSQNKTIETLYLKNREIKTQEKMKLKKIFDTTNYNPGIYNAIAIIDYGKIAKAETEFKIGELVINIVDYTKQIVIRGLQSFNIEIESGWNDNIDGAYAEVFFLNGSTLSFKTSSTSLTPWEKKNITGFFDTNSFTKGFYDANITINYYGKDVGRSSSKLVKVEFIKEPGKILIIFIIVGIIIFLIISVFLIKKYLFKHGKK